MEHNAAPSEESPDVADFGPPPNLHPSSTDPQLSMNVPTHQNIAFWGRPGYLTVSQTDALTQLRRIHPEIGEREALRYLRARSFTVDKASILCASSKEWRRTEKLWETKPEIVLPMLQKGTFILCPQLDLKRRPVVIIDPTHVVAAESVNVVRSFQWMLEAVIANFEPEVDDAVFIFDLRNFGLMHSDSKTPIAMIKSLQTGYPERMAMCIIYSPPRMFSLLWKILRYVIDARVHAKIHFVYKFEEIDKLIGPGVRPSTMGGTEKFDPDAWFKKMEGFTPH